MDYTPIVDIQYIREGGDIPQNATDARIEQLIQEAEYFIREYCNNTHPDGLPLSYRRNIKKMVEFDIRRKTGITSESLSRHSVSYAVDYPSDALKGLKRRLTW